MDGVINFLKPPGMTSHDCVAIIRRMLGTKKVGHTGTLDPAACGVLPLCVGRATRLAEYAQQDDKIYRAEIIIGLTTDTHDLQGRVTSRKTCRGLPVERIRDALDNFKGSIRQIPPDYSAVKHKGEKLYELARRGVQVPEKPRTVVVKDLKLISFVNNIPFPRLTVDVHCSKGTYIRSLCRDIGDLLSTGAVLSFLVRTSSGPFKLENSWTKEEIETAISLGDYYFLASPNVMLTNFPAVVVKSSAVKRVKNGVVITSEDILTQVLSDNQKMVKVLHGDDLLAVGQLNHTDNGIIIKPRKVFI